MREIALHMADIAENSLAAGAARIKLSVMIDRAADRLTTAVEDNGRGIPVDIQEQTGKPGPVHDNAHSKARGLGDCAV